MEYLSNRYFIRSQADPRSHWYLRVNGACLVCGGDDCDTIHVSTEYRTRFCVQVRNLICKNFQPPKDLVIIGSDEISIAASKGYMLRINDEKDLKATKVYQIATTEDLLFRFDDLKNRFVARAEKQEEGEPICEYVVPVQRGLGEGWELVN